ncbi:MAG TPA: hypothetical protein VLL25_08510 [Acidimicrobiales bacterium]|nr:hypothetical protein [Acidimicrobiales bacterium]
MIDELQTLVDPLAGAIVRWGDGGPDGPLELLGALLVTASPQTARLVIETLRLVLDSLPEDAGLTEFCEMVDALAVRAGQRGQGEACGILLDYSGDVANWQGRWQS